MVSTVFEIRQSGEEGRPYGIPQRKSGNADFWKNLDIIRGDCHDLSEWQPMDLFCGEPGLTPVTEWDYFGKTGTSGLFSQRAVDALQKLWIRCFDAMPSLLEGRPYYFLHCRETIDCLNVQESQIVYFDPPDDHNIMRIERYAFHKSMLTDPLIFTIPQEPYFLFATDSVPRISEAAGLKGLEFRKLDCD